MAQMANRKFGFKGIRGRILLLLCIPLMFMLVVAAIGISQIQSIGGNLNGLLVDTVPSLTTSKEIQIEGTRIEATMWGISRLKEVNEDASARLSDLDSSLDRMDSAFERYEKLKMPDKASKLRLAAKGYWNEMKSSIAQMNSLHQNKKFAEFAKIYEEIFKGQAFKLQDTLGNIELNNFDTIEVEQIMSAQLVKRARWFAILGSVMSLVVSLFVCFVMVTRLAGVLSKISDSLSEEASQTRERITAMAGTSEELAQSATHSASAIQETSAAMEQIRVLTEQNETNAQVSSVASNENMKIVSTGLEALQRVRDSFESINVANQEMSRVIARNNDQISGLLGIVEQIGSKTAVINDIVFQTKLLSFNASVEAARAGDHGKGFSVVAEEVGNLARSSGAASIEISTLLEGSKTKMNEILRASQNDVHIVETDIRKRMSESQDAVASSVAFLGEIEQKSSRIDQLVKGIAEAATEQTKGIAEIGRAIDELSGISNNTMTAGKRIAHSTSDIVNRTDSIDVVVQKLHVILRGA